MFLKLTYLDEEFNSMKKSSLDFLKLIQDINDYIVDTQNLLNNDVKLKIDIQDIKFFHNSMMIYAERPVLKYLKEYIHHYIRELNKNDLKTEISTCNSGCSSNGHGTAIYITYNTSIN